MTKNEIIKNQLTIVDKNSLLLVKSELKSEIETHKNVINVINVINEIKDVIKYANEHSINVTYIDDIHLEKNWDNIQIKTPLELNLKIEE